MAAGAGRLGPTGVVAAALLVAALSVRAQEPAATAEQPRVAGIELEIPPGEDAGALRALVLVEPGRPLDPRALRRTVQNLFGVGRFANVIARLRSAGTEGVVLVLTCLPKRVVTGVQVVRRGALQALDDAALKRAAGLGPGDELWPGRLEQVEARLRAALERRGYRQARVRAVAAGDPQASVALEVDEGSPTRVAALVIDASATLRIERLSDGLASQPGAVLDLDALEDDQRLLRTRLRHEGFLRARVAAPVVTVEGELARVEIPVEAGPRFVFRFTGSAAFQPPELREQLGLEAEQMLDAPAIEAAARRIQAFYTARGFAEARVGAKEMAAGEGTVAIVFRVEEGRRYRVRSVHFPGVERPEQALRARLDEALLALAPSASGGIREDAARLGQAVRSPAAPRAPPAADPREAWNPPIWDQAMGRVIEAYRAEGFLDAAYQGTRVVLDARGGTVDVEVLVREGVQTRVEAVALEGARAVSAAEFAREARLSRGDPLSYGGVEAARSALLALYARRGHVYARVTESEEISADRTRATVRFQVEEGPQVKVGRLVISGARRTHHDVIREAVALQPGDVYDPEAAARSQASLLRLGAFRSVALRLADADRPEGSKDVTVEIAERPWLTLAPGAGFSIADGPRAFMEMVQPNLLGRALELSARAKVNYPLDTIRHDLAGRPFFDRVEGRADIGLRDPAVRLLGMQVGARVDAIAQRLHRRAYDLSRGSAVFGLDLPASSRITVQLQYELEVDHIQRSDALQATALTVADVERLRFPEGVTTLQSVRPVLAVDFRDNPLHPRSGWVANGTVDWAHSIGGSGDHYLLGIVPGSDVFTHMLKLSATVTGYVPLSQAVLALSLSGGRVLPLDARSQTIGPKRFFLGGANTMRGYGEDELIPQDRRNAYSEEVRSCASSLSGLGCSAVARQLAQGQTLVSEGGEAFMLVKAELRIPLLQSVEMGLFADAGNLWLDPQLFSATDLRYNVGVGLRFSTPIGPAVIDLGVNLSPDTRLGEHLLAPHFAIGLF